MRLVDANELMEHVWRDKLDSRELIAEMIDNAPTVKEIPTTIPIDVFERLLSMPCESETIKCKDCKHFIKWRSEEEAKEFGQIYLCGLNVLICIEPEDFCSRAEREHDE